MRRCRIEKVSGTWKQSHWLRRMRWLSLAKAGLQVSLTATAYDLKRVVHLVRPVVAPCRTHGTGSPEATPE